MNKKKKQIFFKKIINILGTKEQPQQPQHKKKDLDIKHT